MSSPRATVKRKKRLHGLSAATEFNSQTGFFGLADATPHSAFQVLEHLLLSSFKIHDMTQKGQGRSGAPKGRVTRAAFKPTPSPLAALLYGVLVEPRAPLTGSLYWNAKVGKRERYRAPTT
jgi:hypothetical protein